jgi:5-formyltetrahydrofolate cyclo-ligase
MSTKAEWRAWFRKALARVSDPCAQSKTIRHQLIDRLRGEPGDCIASFSALPGEPSLLELIDALPDHCWVLPRVVGENLVFHQVTHPDQLGPGTYGIAEPGEDLPVVPIGEIKTFLCPGLGFDRQGTRLGRGKGFYDRALADAEPEVLKIGIAFAQQVVDRLPSDPHDEPMDFVITGSGQQIRPKTTE